MKDYSKIFDHYYGLQYDNNVNAVVKVHELMEKAGIEVSSTTKEKLASYSDKRPFKVHYFISKQGKKLKWCPTASEDKLHRMSLKPAEWWIEQLDDTITLTPVINIPNNWLDEQAKHVLDDRITAVVNSLGIRDESASKIVEHVNNASIMTASSDIVKYDCDETVIFIHDDLPF